MNLFRLYDENDCLISRPYPIKFWSVYERIKVGIPRTNNNSESRNRTFNLRTSITLPNIVHFITEPLKGEKVDKFNFVRAQNGLLNEISIFTLKKN